MLLAHCSFYSREYYFFIGNCTADYYVVKKKKIHSFPKAQNQVPVCFADVKNPMTLKEEEWEY